MKSVSAEKLIEDAIALYGEDYIDDSEIDTAPHRFSAESVEKIQVLLQNETVSENSRKASFIGKSSALIERIINEIKSRKVLTSRIIAGAVCFSVVVSASVYYYNHSEYRQLMQPSDVLPKQTETTASTYDEAESVQENKAEITTAASEMTSANGTAETSVSAVHTAPPETYQAHNVFTTVKNTTTAAVTVTATETSVSSSLMTEIQTETTLTSTEAETETIPITTNTHPRVTTTVPGTAIFPMSPGTYTTTSTAKYEDYTDPSTSYIFLERYGGAERDNGDIYYAYYMTISGDFSVEYAGRADFLSYEESAVTLNLPVYIISGYSDEYFFIVKEEAGGPYYVYYNPSADSEGLMQALTSLTQYQ